MWVRHQSFYGENGDFVGEKEAFGGFGFAIRLDLIENESSYRSKSGYTGDAEFDFDDKFEFWWWRRKYLPRKEKMKKMLSNCFYFLLNF